MWQYCLKEKNILLFIRELIFEKVNIVISLSIAPAFSKLYPKSWTIRIQIIMFLSSSAFIELM